MKPIREAIILAGGLGKRMGDSKLPKWLTPIKTDITIAYYQLGWLEKQGIEKIYVTINKHFSPLSFACGWKHQIIWEEELNGDEGSLKGALNHVESKDLLIINCDILTDLDLAKLPTAPALVVVHPRAPWGVLKETPIHEYIIYSIKEKPVLPLWVSSGIYCFPKAIKDELVDNGMLAENIIPKLLKEGRMNVFKHRGLWHAIETPKDVEEAEKILNG